MLVGLIETATGACNALHSRIDPLQNVLGNAYQCSKLLQF